MVKSAVQDTIGVPIKMEQNTLQESANIWTIQVRSWVQEYSQIVNMLFQGKWNTFQKSQAIIQIADFPNSSFQTLSLVSSYVLNPLGQMLINDAVFILKWLKSNSYSK